MWLGKIAGKSDIGFDLGHFGAQHNHQETATLLWLSLDALAVLEHPKASWDVLGGLRMSQDS
jgi:hypothetical protein